jgi:DNA-binding Lrp family transcriptional regulator
VDELSIFLINSGNISFCLFFVRLNDLIWFQIGVLKEILMATLDQMDVKILNLLQRDSSLNVKEIASRIGLSQSPTYERIKKLENEGFIDKYVALVNREKIGKHLMVVCTVTLKEQSIAALKEFEQSIIKFKEVLEVMCIAGSSDYILKIAVEDVNTYHTFVIEQISSIANISNLSSNFVLKELKKDTAIEIG